MEQISGRSGEIVPPNAVEIERQVLGGLLIDPEAATHVEEVLAEDHFYVPAHKLIFQAIINLQRTGQPIDAVTVYTELTRMGKVDEAGGARYVSSLAQNISSAANIVPHANILLEKYVYRKMISISNEVASKAYQQELDAKDLLDLGQQRMLDLSMIFSKRTYEDMQSAVRTVLQHIEQVHLRKLETTAVPTGYIDLDDILGGFQKSDFIILAARPSMGKTALALAFARFAAVEKHQSLVFFSLEMSTPQLVTRLICSEGMINSQNVRTGRMTKEEQAKLPTVAGRLIKAPIYIDDTPSQNILEIRAKARRLKKEKDIKAVFVDYIGLVKGPSKVESREREISIISQSLKALAKELEIPVIALAQLNRAVEQDKDKRPALSNLRESGSLEQDADVVMFIHRPEYYARTEEERMRDKGKTNIIIAKHRNGPTGEVSLNFDKEFGRFSNVEVFDTNYEGAIPTISPNEF